MTLVLSNTVIVVPVCQLLRSHGLLLSVDDWLASIATDVIMTVHHYFSHVHIIVTRFAKCAHNFNVH